MPIQGGGMEIIIMNIEQFYASIGSDATEVIRRLGGSPALVERFLMKFRKDGSFSELNTALAAGDTDVAFRAAHTLKGVCATLGLGRLLAQASSVTELLRDGNLEDAKQAFPALASEYELVIKALD